MEYRDLLEKLLRESKDKMDDAETFLIKSKETEINIYEGEISKYSIAESGGLSLRGLSQGKMGYSYTEKIDETSIDMLISDVLENGKYIDDDPEIIFEGSDSYEDMDNYSQELKKIEVEDKVNFLMNLEKTALDLDERVFAVDGCSYEEFEQERYILNTKGVDLQDKFNGAVVYISVVVKDGEDTKIGLSYKIFNDFSVLDYKEMAKEAVDNAVAMLGANL